MPDSIFPSLQSHGRARDDLLTQIVRAIERDRRIIAAWLKGSLALRTADEWSDVDLYIAVSDDQYDTFVQQRDALHRGIGDVLLTQTIDATRNSENPGSHFDLLVYRGGIEVDWTVMPQRLAHRPDWSRLLFDRAGIAVDVVPPESTEERLAQLQRQLDFFWAMTTVALKEIGRGYTTGAASTIQLMTNAFDLLWRLIYCLEEPHPELRARRHRPIVPELQKCLPHLGSEITSLAALQVVRELCAEVERLHPVLRENAVSIPDKMPGEMVKLGELVECVLLHTLETQNSEKSTASGR